MGFKRSVMIEQVEIKNYKSIKKLVLPLNKLNVLIGSNGAGKSNFISFFELTKAIYEQRFGSYTLSKGGIDNLLYQGRKVSSFIEGLLDFDNNNAFFYEMGIASIISISREKIMRNGIKPCGILLLKNLP